jgi:hypothetical protein
LIYDESFGVRKLLGAVLVLGGLLFIRIGPRWLGGFGQSFAPGEE